MKLGWMSKKVGGVPVVYIVGLFVAILGVVAWRMKSTPAPTDTTDSAPGDGGADADPSSPYGQFNTHGTVTVQQGTDPATVTPIGVQTNDVWARNAANWLIVQGYPGDAANTAMQLYISGEQLSIDQGRMRDLAIKQFGIPPEPLVSGGTAAAPDTSGASQGNPPMVHTVKGVNDNTLVNIARIEYGNADSDHVNFLEDHNPQWARATIPKGTKVNVPVYQSRKWVVPKPMTTAEVATWHHTTTARIIELNDHPLNYTYPKGSVVILPVGTV